MKSGCVCLVPADLDGRGAAPVGEGKPAPGAVFQSSAGEGHYLLPAAPSCADTLTPSLTRSACMHACVRTYMHCISRVYTYKHAAHIGGAPIMLL